MIADFGASSGGVYDPYAADKPDTETRTLGTLVKDELSRAAAVPVGWVRSATNLARSAEENMRGGPATIMEPVDKAVAGAQQYLEQDVPSARSKALDENKWFPKYGERSAWNEPVTSALHALAPLTPYLAAGIATRGAGLATQVGTNVTYGAIGAGEAANKVRDYADRTPIQELKKLEPFQALMREYNGDEQAARTALFQRSTDLVSTLTNAGANMLSFGALQHVIRQRAPKTSPLAAAVGRAVFGAVEGGVAGAAEGAAAEFGEQTTKVKTGQQQAIDIGPIVRGGVEAGASQMAVFSGLGAASGGGRREAADGTQPETEAPPVTPPPATPPTTAIPAGGIDPGIISTARQQINPPKPPAGTPPGGAGGAGNAGALGAPGTGAQVWNQALPGMGPPPISTAPAAVAPVAQGAAPPAGQPAPVVQQAVQPAISVTPPPGMTAPTTAPATAPTTGERTAPVTPAPTAPVQMMWNGQVVTLRGKPQLRAEYGSPDSVMLQLVVDAAGEIQVARVSELSPLTPEVAGAAPEPPVAPAAAPVAAPEVAVQTEAPVAPAAGWLEDYEKTAIKKAADLKLTDRIAELAKTKTATEISQALGGALEPAEVRVVRDSLGIKALGPTSGMLASIPDEVEPTAAPAAPAEQVTAFSPTAPPEIRLVDTGMTPPGRDLGPTVSVDMTPPEAAPAAEPARSVLSLPTEPKKEPASAAAAAAPAGEVVVETKVKPGSKGKPVVKKVAAGRTRPDPENKANTLNRGDVVTPRLGPKYTVERVSHRKEYPTDPLVTISYEGVHDLEQHRASELDMEKPAQSVVRAPKEETGRTGKPREKAEGLGLEPGARVKQGERKPPSGYPNHVFVGLNKQGRELWEATEGPPLRVVKYVGKPQVSDPAKVEKGRFKKKPEPTVLVGTKEKRPIVNIEDPGTIEKRGNRRYVRPDVYRTAKEIQSDADRTKPRRVHRVFLEKGERTSRVEHKLKSSIKKTEEEAEVDYQISEGETDRIIAAPSTKSAPTPDIPKPVPGVVARVTPLPAAGKETVRVEGRPDVEEASIKKDIATFKDDSERVTSETEVVRTQYGRGAGTVYTVDHAWRMGNKEFNERRNALRQRIIALAEKQVTETLALRQDTSRQPSLPERRRMVQEAAKDLIGSLPTREIKAPTTNADYIKQIGILEKLRHLPPKLFLHNDAVKNAIDQIRKINGQRRAANPSIFQIDEARRRGEPAPNDPLPMPDWLDGKLRQQGPGEADSEVMTAYKAALAWEAAHPRVPVAPTEEDIGARIKAEEAAAAKLKADTAEAKRKTDIESAPLTVVDEELKDRIASIYAKGVHPGRFSDYVTKAWQYIEANTKLTDATKRDRKAKVRMLGERESVASNTIVETMKVHLNPSEAKDFLANLVGGGNIVLVKNPKTGKFVRKYQQTQPPKIPAYLTKWGGTGASLTGAERALFDKTKTEYDNALARWQATINKQFEAATKLRQLLEAIISNYKVNIENHKKTGRKGGKEYIGNSIAWHLPKANKDGWHRVGKSDADFHYYNFLSDMQNVLAQLKDAMRHLETGQFAEGAQRDFAKEVRAYMVRMQNPVRKFAFNMQAFLDDKMYMVKEARDATTAEVNASFNISDKATTTDDDGVIVSAYDEAVSKEADTAALGTGIKATKIVAKEVEDRVDKDNANVAKVLGEAGEKARLAAIERRKKEFPLGATLRPYKQGMAFDLDGLPTDGKRWVEFEPYIEDEVDDAYAVLQRGKSDHPLIEPPMTAAQVLGTVKEMVLKGEQGDEISRAITPRFLDRLAKIVENVPAVHAPYEVVSGAGVDTSAYYSPRSDRVVLSNDGTNAYYTRTAVHEYAHAMTYTLMETDAALAADVEALLERARQRLINMGVVPKDYDFEGRYSLSKGPVRLPPYVYGLMNRDEFISEAISSEKFRQYLYHVESGDMPTIGSKVKNVINALYAALQRAFHKVMGRTDGDTALDVLFYDQSNVLGKTDKLVSRVMRGLEHGRMTRYNQLPEGHPAFVYGYESQLPMPGSAFTKRAHPAAGTADANTGEFTRNLRSYAGRTLADVRDAANVRHNKATLLGAHTAFDLGRRTSDTEFQSRVHTLTKVKGKIDRERKRIREDEDGPVIELIGTYLRGLSPKAREVTAKALIAETEHTAYLDAPLGETDDDGKLTGRNAHIDPNDIANVQTVADHEWLQRNVYAPAAKIKGFVDLRSKVHAFYRAREAQVRSAFVRTMTEAYGLMPEGLDRDAHETTLAALEKYVTGKKAVGTMTDAEKAAMDQFDLTGENEASKKFDEKVSDIRKLLGEYSHAAGPYMPLVRHGEFVNMGKYVLPPTTKGEIVMRRDRRPGPAADYEGKEVDANIRVFKNLDDLKTYERTVSEQLGVAQIGGGRWYFDPATNERMMAYTPADLEEVNKKRAEAGEKPLQNRRASKADIDAMIEAGRPVEERYWIEFSPTHYSRHDSRNEARAEVAELRGKFKDKIQMTDPQQARTAEGSQSEQHISDTMQKVMNSLKASPEYVNLDQHQRTELNNRLRFITQKAVMHRGVRQRYQPRRFVKGASHDILRAASDYAGTTSAWLAKMKFAPELTEAWRELNIYNESRKYEAGDRDSEARGAITDYIGQRLHEDPDPMVEGWVNRNVDRLIRWTMLDKLPGVAYFGTNATEPIILTAPLLMGRHSVLNTVAKIREAYSLFGPLRMLGGGVADMARVAVGGKVHRKYQEDFAERVLKHKYGVGLVDLVNFLSEHGMYDQTSGLEYQQMARQATTGVGAPLDKTADYLTRVFQAMNVSIENLNRMVSGASAYILERERLDKSGDPNAHEKAKHYSWEIINKASGIYSNYNAPAWFNKTPFHRLAFEFKKYPQRIIANYIDAVVGTVKGDKEKARQLAAMLTVQGTVAGVLGLPTDVFSIPVDALFLAGVTDENSDDYKLKFRKWAAEQFGKDGGDILSYGILRASGVDFQSRLSQADLIFFGAPQSQKVQDLRGAAMGILMGAGGGVIGDWLTGMQKMADSHHAAQSGNETLAYKLAVQGTRLLVPFRAVTDFIDSQVQSTTEGMETQSGRRRAEPLDRDEQLTRMLGFTPTRVAEQQETSRTLNRLKKRDAAERARFMAEFSTGNAMERQRVWARVQEWNKNQPLERKLTFDQLYRASVTRDKAEAQPLDYAGVALDRRSRSFLSELPT